MRGKTQIKFTIATDLVERAEVIRQKFIANGQSSVAMRDVLDALIRDALDKSTEVRVNKLWTLRKAWQHFCKSDKDNLSAKLLTPETLKVIQTYLQDRTEETKLALEKNPNAKLEERVATPRNPKVTRKKKKVPSTDDLLGESAGESRRAASADSDGRSVGERS